MPSQIQLIGGAFQDSEGNVLANGYLEFRLSQDGTVTGVGNICSGITIRIQLDSNGNAASSTSTPPAPNQFIWGDDNILPVNNFYRVTGYAANGQPAWGPNNQQVEGSGPFNLGTWIPNQIISWVPPVQAPVLEVNGTPISSQSPANFESGSGIVVSNPSAGNILISATGGGGGVLGKWPGNWSGAMAAGIPPGSFSFTGGGNLGAAFVGYNAAFISGSNSATSTEGTRLPDIAPSGNTSSAGLIDQNLDITLGILEDWFTKIQVRSTASPSRYWIGFSDQSESTAPSVFFSNTPAANFVGFRFSTTAGDTAWQAVCQTGSGNQTVVSTGVTPNSSTPQVLEVVPTNSGATVTFYINGILVATISTTVPATSVAMASILSEGDAAFNSSFDWYYLWFLSSN